METKPGRAMTHAAAPSFRSMPGTGVPERDSAERIPDRARRLRIAVLSDALKDRNGVDAYYRDLVHHLRPHVAEIALLSPNREDGDLRGVPAVPMPGDATQEIVFPHPLKLSRRVRALRPNAVVSATNGPFGLVGIQIARRCRAAFFAGFHTLIEGLCAMYWRGGVGRLACRFMESQNRLLFRFARRVVVNSPDMEDSAAALSRTPVAVMGTPVDRRFLEAPTSPPDPELRRILFAGRLAMEKNVLAVVEAARRLPERSFAIAGDGPLRETIRAAARTLPNLAYRGRVPRNRMAALMDEHDLLILPSELEAFGTVALEAMARERLALVSPRCGILAWPGLSRGLFSMDEDETPADALRRISALDPALRRKRAREARRAALALNREAVAQWLRLLSDDAP